MRLGYRTLPGRICEERRFRARLSNLCDGELSGQKLEPYSAGKATAVRAFGEITKKIAQGAFSKFPKIKSVQIIGNLALRDKHGNDTVDRAVMVKFSKVKAATIKWESVDPASVVEIADKHWILPELGADKK